MHLSTRSSLFCDQVFPLVPGDGGRYPTNAVNPYDPPSAPLETSVTATTVRARRGPALYIVVCGLLGGFASLPFLAIRSPLAFVAILVGCVSGGLLYRSVSRDWQHDESVRRRQLIYSAISAILPTVSLALTANDERQAIAYAFIGAVVGGSVACGILVSGTKRLHIPTGG